MSENEPTGRRVDEDVPEAFPRAYHGRNGQIYAPGMSLRDYFAGKVLEGIYAYQGEGDGEGDDLLSIAEGAYAQADAMLKARKS